MECRAWDHLAIEQDEEDHAQLPANHYEPECIPHPLSAAQACVQIANKGYKTWTELGLLMADATASVMRSGSMAG